MNIDLNVIDSPPYKESFIENHVEVASPFSAFDHGIVVCFNESCKGKELKVSRSIDCPRLVLYVRSSCPYCKEVTKYLKKQHKLIPIRNIEKDKNALHELIHAGGKKQVPCLVINGRALYESVEILNWLEMHKNQY